MCRADVVLKHKNVSSIEEYNIGDRLKYSRIKQSSKKDIEESRISIKYQEHYRSITHILYFVDKVMAYTDNMLLDFLVPLISHK